MSAALLVADSGPLIALARLDLLDLPARCFDSVLVMDDRRARQVAVALGRPVLGTLGLLLRAREEGFVAGLRPLIDHLQATGYYLPADLVEAIFSSLRE